MACAAVQFRSGVYVTLISCSAGLLAGGENVTNAGCSQSFVDLAVWEKRHCYSLIGVEYKFQTV